jgi:RNA polymerase sigma-70 factor (ECF subfamily)
MLEFAILQRWNLGRWEVFLLDFDEIMSQRTPEHLRQADDQQLVKIFQDGADADVAFMVLFERYGSLTYGFFRRRIGNAETAAELNQDLYMTVIKYLPTFRGESSFKTWLFRVAQNSLSHLRRRWRTHMDERGDEIPEGLWDGLTDEKAEGSDEVLNRSQIATALKGCLARLPETERAVILGNYFEGTTLRELSERLQMDNSSGARAYQIAGLRKLRRCLAGEGVHGLK